MIVNELNTVSDKYDYYDFDCSYRANIVYNKTIYSNANNEMSKLILRLN